jgi:hypothetical protein
MANTPAAAPPADPRLDGLPADDFGKVRMLMRAPFTPGAIRWKVQQTWRGGALIVGYIDARLVIERLNLLVGPNWSDQYEPTTGGNMWCHLTVCGVTRSDVGEGKGKALVSDALKRAAVHFGVGVSLYAIPRMMLNPGELLKDTGRTDPNGKPRYEITAKGGDWLYQSYTAWLAGAGQAFGEPFDHGDVRDAQGDVELEAGPSSAPGDFEARADAAAELAAPTESAEDPDIESVRAQVRAKLEEAGDEMAEARIRGAGNNIGALRDLYRFAVARLKEQEEAKA